jgi:hypothetical protein
MASRYDLPTRKGRYSKTWGRRTNLLQLLREGRAIHGETLRNAVMPDRSMASFYLLIRCMRADGYLIEALGSAHWSKGYRLISEPACAA